ncbi:MAG TPA: prepilin peptidase [Hyphomicrobiaceae bacterium]|nr:prepilin peptidase [Hyphomicrobiaceae bacterium]
MAFAGSMDLFTMTIPNRISLALIAAFVVAAPYCGLTVTQIAWHLGCGFLMLVIGILMFSRGWLGGGDAKLLAAASLWLGFEHLLGYLVLVAVAGGMLASTIMLYRSMTIPLCLIGQGWASRLHEKTSGIPYGIALAAAALWIYPSTTWFKVLVA